MQNEYARAAQHSQSLRRSQAGQYEKGQIENMLLIRIANKTHARRQTDTVKSLVTSMDSAIVKERRETGSIINDREARVCEMREERESPRITRVTDCCTALSTFALTLHDARVWIA
jgi:hypothetical protein